MSLETTAAAPHPLQRRTASLVASPWFWTLLVLAMMTWPIIRAVRATVPPKLPKLTRVGSFQLTDQAGRPFGSQDLENRVWVANFIFTRCPTVCPLFTEKMAEIQRRLHQMSDVAHLVSFSVDPEYDTPERLLAYGIEHRFWPHMWSFLTGAPPEVKKAVVEGLKVSMGRDGPPGNFMGIFHGGHFVVVDQTGMIRAYVDSHDEDAVERVVRDVGLLANRGD